MKEYLLLQQKLSSRKMADFGLNPALGYFLALSGFIGLSLYLFYKTEFAQYIYMLVAISTVAKLGEAKRNDFLKSCFGGTDYLKIRLAENGIAILPFVLFLAYKMLFFAAFSIIAAAGVAVFFKFDHKTNVAIPTPFSQTPFEFAIGFRASFLAITFAYFLAIMAIWAGNFNLGVFSLALTFLITLTFYTQPENEFFVWSFSMSPQQFLRHKVWTAIVHSTLLSLPIVGMIGFFFFAQVEILLLVQVLGYAALTTVILAKYSAYPNPMNVPQIILVAISIQVPPVIILVIPVFYLQAIKHINRFLS